jgi:putative phosphoribosyl transferase
MLPFSDRAEAGRFLALEVSRHVELEKCVVLALPRGGVPVAFEIALLLGAPLDLLFVKKVGVPWQPELALAAVASGGVSIIEHQLVCSLNLPDFLVKKLVAEKKEELETGESAFRARHPALPLKNRTVIVVDDGAATGSSMMAGLRSVGDREPNRIVVAVPVASQDAAERFRFKADKIVCLACPEPFTAVGCYYKNFHQVSDEEVERLLTASGNATAKTDALVSAAHN